MSPEAQTSNAVLLVRPASFGFHAEAVLGDGKAWTCENVARAAMAEMIAMRMRDDGRLHRLPGVDVEIPRRAVEAAVRADHERCGI